MADPRERDLLGARDAVQAILDCLLKFSPADRIGILATVETFFAMGEHDESTRKS